MANNLFKINKVPQALIVRQAPLSNFDAFLKDFMKFVCCDKQGCNKCDICKRINDGQYFDLIVLDAKTSAKKSEILEIVSRFNRNGLELPNKKFYVIKNIEYSSAKVLNSLLKFVEEPPVGVYAIFTTRNYNAVLPTIRSRCFSYYLETDETDVDQFLVSKDLKPDQKKLIKKCFFELDEMKENYDNFIKFYDLIKKLVSKEHLSYATEGLSLFRKLTNNEISLFIEIAKNLYPSICDKLIELQNNLYLNPNKSLTFSQIYDLLIGAK